MRLSIALLLAAGVNSCEDKGYIAVQQYSAGLLRSKSAADGISFQYQDALESLNTDPGNPELKAKAARLESDLTAAVKAVGSKKYAFVKLSEGFLRYYIERTNPACIAAMEEVMVSTLDALSM